MKRGRQAIAMAATMSIGAVSWGAEMASAPESPTVKEGAYRRSDGLVWTTLGFSVLHHTDHVIRDTHSGFPFTPHLTAFTPSLLVYPLVIGGIVCDAGPLYWTIFDATALVGVVAIHATLEPLDAIYEPWADGSNLTGVRSSAMGGVALIVLSGLTLGLAASLVSSIVDGRRYGFTWKRKPLGTNIAPSNFSFSATPDGKVLLSFRW